MSDDNIGIISQEGERYILGNYLVNASQLQNIYSGTDDVNAFYGMLTYNLTDKLKFIGVVDTNKPICLPLVPIPLNHRSL
ncbi:MAG: hypothetical protein HC892_19055, partial [Saprospiraceae bacterium]|nr:hypothetical protein [Saprospiraceae bacterium]